MSFHEIAIAITARDEATTTLRAVARDVASLGASAVAIAKLGEQFGVLRKETAGAISTIGSMVALFGTVSRGIAALNKITSVATAIQWAHNASLAMKISLLTLGIGLIAATAAYMGYLAAATRDATGAMDEFNASVAATPGRGIRRAGEEELYRQGVEQP